jgi:uncharacterized membrane protein YhaH (DUF805 family)
MKETRMDGFTNSIKVCIANFTNFNGRASRAEYWWFFLFGFLITSLMDITSSVQILANPNEKETIKLVYNIITIAFAIPFISVATRRLHDIGKSGWW